MVVDSSPYSSITRILAYQRRCPFFPHAKTGRGCTWHNAMALDRNVCTTNFPSSRGAMAPKILQQTMWACTFSSWALARANCRRSSVSTCHASIRKTTSTCLVNHCTPRICPPFSSVRVFCSSTVSFQIQHMAYLSGQSWIAVEPTATAIWESEPRIIPVVAPTALKLEVSQAKRS